MRGAGVRRVKEQDANVRLRPFSADDLDRIMEIERRSFEVGAYSRARFEEMYRRYPKGFFVAEMFGEVIGYAMGSISGEAGELNSLAVDPRFRNLGIGQKLVERVLEGFRARGIRTCSLKVRITNESAVRLYASIGFQIVKTVESLEPGVDAYLMRTNVQQDPEKVILARLLKKAQMQGSPAFAEAATRRQAKSCR